MTGSTLDVQQQEAQHREQVIDWACERAAARVIQQERRSVAIRNTMDEILNDHESMGSTAGLNETNPGKAPSSFQIEAIAQELRPLVTRAVDALYES